MFVCFVCVCVANCVHKTEYNLTVSFVVTRVRIEETHRCLSKHWNIRVLIYLNIKWKTIERYSMKIFKSLNIRQKSEWNSFCKLVSKRHQSVSYSLCHSPSYLLLNSCLPAEIESMKLAQPSARPFFERMQYFRFFRWDQLVLDWRGAQLI